MRPAASKSSDVGAAATDLGGALVVAFAVRSRSRLDAGSAAAVRDRLLRIRGPDAAAAHAVADWLLAVGVPDEPSPNSPTGDTDGPAHPHPTEKGA